MNGDKSDEILNIFKIIKKNYNFKIFVMLNIFNNFNYNQIRFIIYWILY